MTNPKPIRTFVIVHPDGTESGSYRGRSPRRAAIKAMKADFPVTEGLGVLFDGTLKLRERGTKKIHVFHGNVTNEDAPENRPAWIPAKIKVAHVEKIGIEKIDRLGPALVAEGVLTGEQLKEIEKLPAPEQKEKVN